MTEKLRKWTSDESEKMCDSFWKLEPESQVRIYILALAEKIHSIMQERGSELGLDNQEIALGQKILGYLKDNNQHLACAYIDTVPKGSVLKKYITGIQRRWANLMEPRRTLSDKKNYAWHWPYYRFRNSDTIAREIFPENEPNESVFFHGLFPKNRD